MMTPRLLDNKGHEDRFADAAGLHSSRMVYLRRSVFFFMVYYSLCFLYFWIFVALEKSWFWITKR